MHFYTHRHKYYCGIDLHPTVMYVCITDATGTVLVHRNLRTNPESFVRVIEPYREDLAVAVECVFVWYWIADLCAQLGVTFILGHALYMRSVQFAEANCRRSRNGFFIHGGKVKNDRIDSEKIVQLLSSGMLPEAYAYPETMRSTRDLLRRRMYLVRRHAELQGHIQNTTILDLAGVAAPEASFHGRSFAGIIDEPSPENWREEVFASHTFHEITNYYPMRVVRTRRRSARARSAFGARSVEAYIRRPRLELYDLDADPNETVNLADSPAHRDLVESFSAKLKEFQERTDDPWLHKWTYE